jgi:hypothetical protein
MVRHLAPTREQALKEQVDAATLAFHQLQVVEDARKAVVSAAALVEDVLRRDADRQPSRVHDLEPIGMQAQVDVTPLRVGPVHQRVHEQLANDELVVGR